MFGDGIFRRCIAYWCVWCVVAVTTGDLSFLRAAYAVEPVLTASLLQPSAKISAPVLKGISFDPKTPLTLTFILDSADHGYIDRDEAQTLVDYFFAAVAAPQSDLWVNLSPYEKDRIVADGMGTTVLGETLLAQDYLLKQYSSSLTDPQTDLGKSYWAGVSQERPSEKKIWIKPDAAKVYEHGDTVYVSQATMKVESESPADRVLLPALENEVNHGERFAPVRQAYHSIILALWFKKHLRETFFKSYIDANDLGGITTASEQAKERYYDAYLASFNEGVYRRTQKVKVADRLTKRTYFSGGITAADAVVETTDRPAVFLGREYQVTVSVVGASGGAHNATASSAAQDPDYIKLGLLASIQARRSPEQFYTKFFLSKENPLEDRFKAARKLVRLNKENAYDTIKSWFDEADPQMVYFAWSTAISEWLGGKEMLSRARVALNSRDPLIRIYGLQLMVKRSYEFDDLTDTFYERIFTEDDKRVRSMLITNYYLHIPLNDTPRKERIDKYRDIFHYSSDEKEIEIAREMFARENAYFANRLILVFFDVQSEEYKTASTKNKELVAEILASSLYTDREFNDEYHSTCYRHGLPYHYKSEVYAENMAILARYRQAAFDSISFSADVADHRYVDNQARAAGVMHALAYLVPYRKEKSIAHICRRLAKPLTIGADEYDMIEKVVRMNPEIGKDILPDVEKADVEMRGHIPVLRAIAQFIKDYESSRVSGSALGQAHADDDLNGGIAMQGFSVSSENAGSFSAYGSGVDAAIFSQGLRYSVSVPIEVTTKN